MHPRRTLGCTSKMLNWTAGQRMDRNVDRSRRCAVVERVDARSDGAVDVPMHVSRLVFAFRKCVMKTTTHHDARVTRGLTPRDFCHTIVFKAQARIKYINKGSGLHE